MRYVISLPYYSLSLTALIVRLYILTQNAGPVEQAYGRMATLTKGTVEDARRPDSSPRPKGRGKSWTLLYSRRKLQYETGRNALADLNAEKKRTRKTRSVET